MNPTNPTVAELLTIIAGLVPTGIAIVGDIRAWVKQTGLPADQALQALIALAGATEPVYDALAATIKADQAAHPPA